MTKKKKQAICMNIFLCFYRCHWTAGGFFICEAHLCADRLDVWYKVLCGAGNGTACVHLMLPRAYRLHSLVNGCKWCNNKSPVRHCSRTCIMWFRKCRFLRYSNLLFVLHCLEHGTHCSRFPLPFFRIRRYIAWRRRGQNAMRSSDLPVVRCLPSPGCMHAAAV